MLKTLKYKVYGTKDSPCSNENILASILRKFQFFFLCAWNYTTRIWEMICVYFQLKSI